MKTGHQKNEKMKKCFFAIILLLIISAFSYAQSETDALRYSQVFPGGTARFAAMGGAFGALGGDFSAISINPAGIAIYRGSEITVTPALNYSKVNTKYFNIPEEDMKYDFNLNNIGAVFAFPTGRDTEKGGWQYVNFGIGLNRQNNFNDRWIATGFNPNNSFMTSLLEQAIREGSVDRLSNFSTGLAWDTWLLGKDEETGFFVDMPDGKVMQHQETNESGSIREFVLSFGANYSDRLYLGATVGFPYVNYEENTIFSEKDSENHSEVFNSLTYTNSVRTSGSGYNFKLGAIFRVNDMIRVGGAFHTPTFYELKDRYRTSMKSDLNIENSNYKDFARSPEGRFDYEVNTPLKAIGSVALVFGNMGIVNVDYEYVDYTKVRLRSKEYLFADENALIRKSFDQQHNIRVGGEMRLDPVVLRAGYAYYSSPYKSGINDGQRTLLSAGFGIREGNFFIDFAYTYAFYSDDYFLYQLEGPSPLVTRDFSASSFRVSLGRRF